MPLVSRARAGSKSPSAAVGLTLGGGIGWLTKLAGLSCDNLVAAEVVTADSRIVRASRDQKPDLIWALRGGGGGNFGVVTSFEFALRPVGPDMGPGKRRAQGANPETGTPRAHQAETAKPTRLIQPFINARPP